MTDILEVATKVVPKDSPEIQQAMVREAKKDEIANLKKQIKTLENELAQKKEEKENMWPSEKWQFQKPTLGTFFHGIIGAGAGALLSMGAYMITSVLLAKLGATKLAGSKGLFPAIAIPFAVAGAGLMIGEGEKQGNIEHIVKKEYNRPENYQDSVQYNKAEQFKQEQIVPLEKQISKLKHEAQAKSVELLQMYSR